MTSAQVQVDQAREALTGTVLRAPTGGTVISVSGVKGEVVTAGGNTVSTPQSSDSTATDTTGSSATGVVMISDVEHLELHAYFSETDAAQLKVGQKATATLNAISDVTLRGTVVQIDATSTIVSNVVEYGVTIHLPRHPAGIKQGQTANVQVNTSVVHNALYVSSAAITSAGGQHTVSVLNDDGTQSTITVEVGLEGDQTTQITSGLSEKRQGRRSPPEPARAVASRPVGSRVAGSPSAVARERDGDDTDTGHGPSQCSGPGDRAHRCPEDSTDSTMRRYMP